jgi:hypothetical protein
MLDEDRLSVAVIIEIDPPGVFIRVKRCLSKAQRLRGNVSLQSLESLEMWAARLPEPC